MGKLVISHSTTFSNMLRKLYETNKHLTRKHPVQMNLFCVSYTSACGDQKPRGIQKNTFLQFKLPSNIQLNWCLWIQPCVLFTINLSKLMASKPQFKVKPFWYQMTFIFVIKISVLLTRIVLLNQNCIIFPLSLNDSGCYENTLVFKQKLQLFISQKYESG